MKIGIFGGTFNPPHLGHIRACRAFSDIIKTDRLFVIPTYLPPLKQAYDISPAHRLEMCRLAFPFAEICDFEIRSGGVSYTYKTVRYFRESYPDAELFMLIGTDQLAQLEKWREAEYLSENLIFAVVPRYGDKAELEKEFERHLGMGFRLVMVPIAETEVSSTEIRSGSSALLTPEVAKYIKEHHLYYE